ncbi:transglycosylase domain-containing protein [Actinoplanes oblitus]|uniref:Transglycosylase domain-containing protein n=1 Tax=Actinoplanes oblitus TaxID=3040509 RepID=A0ABY8WFE7_9ACTN|nr:transglycosylase domain-containing protein [Actinoplanes oblitus]WIM96535.1 transglycosylase domain-containing protein [Actinoplanes oblitus]
MNAYGDPQNARARAKVPGPSAASGPDEGRPAPDAYRRPAGSASVGSASVGSASVGGRASVGSASVGSASVGSATPGRASVSGAAPVGGRASVPPPGSGGGGGSVGGGGGGKRPRSKADKKYRRANILTAAAAVLVIMIGAGIVGGTYFFDDVELPTPKAEDQMNVVLNAKGQVLYKTGDPRVNVPYQNISDTMAHAVAAAEDKNFYTHNGIDMKGIARAAWNNFTGGDKQGASTITQQYARHVAVLKDISYSRKLREAVIARKLESKYEKPEIMGLYLNYIDLGEGRLGAEAAANGYYNVSIVHGGAGGRKEINPYQAAVIASIIKQPYPTATHRGYDPLVNPTASKDRWEYTMKNMLEMGWISQDVYDKRKWPQPLPAKTSATCKTCADGKPVGMIRRHVTYELSQLNISKEVQDKGGLTITTTIDPVIQKAAEQAGSRKSDDSPLHGRPSSYQSAVIGIDPDTGEVLGYYGGDDPEGVDYGGYMNGDGSGVMQNGGGQSPASSFKIYTLSAALTANYSFKTTWDGTLTRANGKKISNAGADDSLCDGKIKFCDLETATIRSYNFPFYWIADKLHPSKVLAAAKAAGIRYVWTNGSDKHPQGERIDLEKASADTLDGKFSSEVGFGQFRVIPLEHATGVATIVAQGVRHKTHFIKSIKAVDPATNKPKSLTTITKEGVKVFDKNQMSDLSAVLKQIPAHANHTLSNGRDAIAKSGSWELNTTNSSANGDAWFVGGIPQLAATVWVGGKTKRVPLTEESGKKMFGSGTPASIWKKFLDTVAEKKNWDEAKFPDRVPGGDDTLGNGQTPPEPDPTTTQDNSGVCDGPLSVLCQGQNNGTGGNNNGGNNTGGGNNDGGGNDGGGGNNGGGDNNNGDTTG